MKIALVWIGKTVAPYLVEAVNDYVKRVRFYTPFEVVEVPGLKKLLLKTIEPTDVVVLLDDKGRQMTSVEFAAWIEKHKQVSARRLVFVVGGAYGFSRAVYDRANTLISLSKMTYSHQMVRLVFVEQLYRAHTITAGEPYHHEDSLLKQS